MIKCPLTGNEIEAGECVTIVDACDGVVKDRILGKSILDREDWKEICRKCQYHDN